MRMFLVYPICEGVLVFEVLSVLMIVRVKLNLKGQSELGARGIGIPVNCLRKYAYGRH